MPLVSRGLVWRLYHSSVRTQRSGSDTVDGWSVSSRWTAADLEAGIGELAARPGSLLPTV
jgi:hypothetical protein